MQSFSFRIWTRVTVSISYDDNHYTTGPSFTWRGEWWQFNFFTIPWSDSPQALYATIWPCSKSETCCLAINEGIITIMISKQEKEKSKKFLVFWYFREFSIFRKLWLFTTTTKRILTTILKENNHFLLKFLFRFMVVIKKKLFCFFNVCLFLSNTINR